MAKATQIDLLIRELESERDTVMNEKIRPIEMAIQKLKSKQTLVRRTKKASKPVGISEPMPERRPA